MVLLQVLQKSYFNQSFINDEFVIDDTLGRDVKFAIDVLSGMPTEVSIFYSVNWHFFRLFGLFHLVTLFLESINGRS